jgi:pSer/pThr/pTyr-binding forkhead associated (FHA) protein
VFLNGVKIHSATLREGDNIQLGDVIVIYHEGT